MDVGPIPIIASGNDIISKVESVVVIDGVIKAVPVKGMYLNLDHIDDEYNMWLEAWMYNPEFFSEFPDAIESIEGSLPTDDNQIAFHSEFASQNDINIGDFLNYSYDDDIYYLLEVIGIIEFFDSDAIPSYEIYPVEAIISGNVIQGFDLNERLILEIDRSRLTPFDTAGSMQYLENIDDTIRRLDPNYDSQYGWSNYYIKNLLSNSLMEFTFWKIQQRMNQIFRSAGVGLLVGLLIFLAIRHNINERRYESSMLIARGASEGDINGIINREIGILSLVALPLGILCGVMFSRIAMVSTGFLLFDFTRIITEPFMVSLESLITASILGFLLPPAVLISYRTIYSTKRKVQESEGKLAKLSRILAYIRWDGIVLFISIVAILITYNVGNLLYAIPFLIPILAILPVLLFVALSSLCTKGLRRGAIYLASLTSRITGFIPSAVGVRRIGKEASSAGPAMMVLVLTISLVWTSATLSASLPITEKGHTRFGIGGDVAFALSHDYEDSWNEFFENISLHESTESLATVTNVRLSLSATYSESTRFSAVDPLEYIEVGYDEYGVPLNESLLGDTLKLLDDTPTGAIVTEDIAEDYDLIVGDTLRAFQITGQDTDIITFTILDIVEAIPDTNLFNSDSEWHYYPTSNTIIDSGPSVGKRAIWINWDFIDSAINITERDTRVCVRIKENMNGTKLVQSMISQGSAPLFSFDNWQSVSSLYDEYVSSSNYVMDRAVDSMILAVEILVLFGTFTLYAAEGIRNRRREIALLRSLGAERSLVVKAQSAEMLVISLLSINLLVIFTPVLFSNATASHMSSYGGLLYMFPVTMLVNVPWLFLISILGLLMGAILIFVVSIAYVSSRLNIAGALNASWTEAGPYGGDV